MTFGCVEGPNPLCKLLHRLFKPMPFAWIRSGLAQLVPRLVPQPVQTVLPADLSSLP